MQMISGTLRMACSQANGFFLPLSRVDKVIPQFFFCRLQCNVGQISHASKTIPLIMHLLAIVDESMPDLHNAALTGPQRGMLDCRSVGLKAPLQLS
jgi:hypothetical protein